MALAPYYGYNQEDAFVFNKASIERGLFSYIVYASYSAVAGRDNKYVDSFARPLNPPDPKIYHALDENGIAKLGVTVEEGDVVISKSRRYTATGKVDVEDVRLGIGEKGTVSGSSSTRTRRGSSSCA